MSEHAEFVADLLDSAEHWFESLRDGEPAAVTDYAEVQAAALLVIARQLTGICEALGDEEGFPVLDQLHREVNEVRVNGLWVKSLE